MLYPILPIFLTQTLKASGSVVGLVEGIAQATQNIVQGFSGWLSDRLQKRKPVALAGYVLAAVAKPLMGLATTWQGVLGGRFLDRLGAGTRTAPAMRSSRLRWMRRTGARRLGLRVSAIMPVPF
jgi:MFS family permease